MTSRVLQKRGGAVLGFDITDRTSSIKISRFLRSDDDQSIIDKVKVGDHLIVQGEIIYSKYDDDMILDPRNIVKGKRYIRPDNAEEKRVELHLHTRFSALDALTDPAKVVERAAYWGMPAIAVTDHGVAQAFPDMWKAGKKYGVKIIYGMEAYFVNDMDGNNAVIGKSKLPLDTEFVAFDIETTGLNAMNDRMTEIGAVIFSGGEIKAEFNTFVNPQRHIPPDITQLTGIRDSDVADAPLEKEAMEMFLEFAGNRPLVAHNAHFDVGFMAAASNRCGLKFSPVFLDTLALSQALLPELKRFKLDIVSNHLNLPQFNHHRASDDAMVVARMMDKFLPMLRQQGARTLDDIETVYHSLRRTDVAKTYHMILLVKNKKGLKNLYEMISQSYLKYFHRSPTIPKSLLIQHREGIIVGSACGMGELYGAVMKGASEKETLLVGRGLVLVLSLIAFAIANSKGSGAQAIMDMVENAWGAFGASFGPTILLSLFWRRFNYKGAVAGVVSGFVVDLGWLLTGLTAFTGIFEIVPGFIASFIIAVIVAKCTAAPNAKAVEIFDKGTSKDAD